MPRAERDSQQPGVYYFRETADEKRSRLMKEDLLNRLEALEVQARRSDPAFKVPGPPPGLERRRAEPD